MWLPGANMTGDASQQEESAVDPDQIINETITKYEEYVNPGLARLARFAGFGDVEAGGRGAVVTDLSGNEYLDCLGGYGVFSLGHAHPRVVAAVADQLTKLPLSTKLFFNKPMADLCEMLAGIAPGDLKYSFICNSGTEAVEGALKAARKKTGRANFVAARAAFHGKTLGSLSASGRDIYKQPFEPLVPVFDHVPFGDIDAMAQAVTRETAAVILEPIQGEAGIHVPPAEYLPAVREICDAAGALLILDEVQTGMGRTGKMFACEHWGVKPDIMTLAKALGGGVMPIGAFMGTPDVWEVFEENPLLHTSTFGGNPLACRAAIAAIEVTLEENLPARAAVMGERFISGLRAVAAKHPGTLEEVRGLGLMIGVQFASEEIGELSISGMSGRGVIAAYTLNNPKVMRFEPPLIITEEQVDQALTAFDEAVAEAAEMVREVS